MPGQSGTRWVRICPSGASPGREIIIPLSLNCHADQTEGSGRGMQDSSPGLLKIARRVNRCRMLIILLCPVALFCGSAGDFPAAATVQEIVNPHWTGKHCGECHLEGKPKDKEAALRFNGDSIQLCNRCHATGVARPDVHPVGVPLSEGMEQTMPRTFPLDDGRLSCLTCHDLLPQMKEDFVFKSANRKFIRGAPYETLSTFCFFCHNQEEYKKTNPHQQLDRKGGIIEERCLLCHQSVPDPLQAGDIRDVSFTTTLSGFCVNCHFRQKSAHPARADHLTALPDFLRAEVPERAGAKHAELPLDGDRIFCGTCHNPHAKGVIQRRAAAAGAGEEHFLRLNGGYDLCVTCHKDKELTRVEGALRAVEGPPGLPQEMQSDHKPVRENLCKRCHSITAEQRERPPALSLCFKTDCHTTQLLNREFVHELTVGEDCYLCHSAHVSTYEKLLRLEKSRLCQGCHPLLRDDTGSLSAGIEPGDGDAKGGAGAEASPPVRAKKAISKGTLEKSSKEHAVFVDFFRTTPVDQGRVCGFCHSPYHEKELGSLPLKSCARCHTFVRETLTGRSPAPLNIHDTFQEKACTACHDPHAAPFQHVLKKPLETYLPAAAKSPPRPLQHRKKAY